MSHKKAITLWSAVSIGIGGMVGGGIYSLLGAASGIAGNAVYISFVIAGLVALFSTYSYAKLGAKFPSAGGPVEFLVQGFGDNVFSGGFNILLWFGYIFALALYARAFGAYATTLLHSPPWYWENIFATGIVILFTAINFIGAKAMGRAELVTVAVNIGVLILFSVIGFFFVKPALLSPAKWPHLDKIFFAAGVVFLTFEGFGLVTNAAEDMENPAETLPRALYISVLVVIVLYVSVSLTVVGNLPIPQIVHASDYAAAAAAQAFLGPAGLKIIAIAALFATSSAINATLYGGANVSFMIAKDGELPQIFERKAWGRAPEGLFVTAILVILFANTFPLDKIGMMGSAAFLLIYAAVSVGHMRLYKQTGASPFLIVMAILACLFALVILVYYLGTKTPVTLIALSVVVALSFLAEWLYRRYTTRKLRARAIWHRTAH